MNRIHTHARNWSLLMTFCTKWTLWLGALVLIHAFVLTSRHCFRHVPCLKRFDCHNVGLNPHLAENQMSGCVRCHSTLTWQTKHFIILNGEFNVFHSTHPHHFCWKHEETLQHQIVWLHCIKGWMQTLMFGCWHRVNICVSFWRKFNTQQNLSQSCIAQVLQSAALQLTADAAAIRCSDNQFECKSPKKMNRQQIRSPSIFLRHALWSNQDFSMSCSVQRVNSHFVTNDFLFPFSLDLPCEPFLQTHRVGR